MNQTLMYFGHHKCATQWINAVVISACVDMGFKFARFHNPKLFHENLNETIIRNQYQFVAYTNANYQYTQAMTIPFRGFHVIRDPRDIIVSSYFSSLNSHPTNQWPELIPHREKLKASSLDEGLLLEMDFIQDVMEHLGTWNYNQPNVLELRFEEVTRKPYQSFLDIFEFLGVLDDFSPSHTKRLLSTLRILARRAFKFLPPEPKITADLLLGRVYQNRFSKKTAGRAQGREDAQSHFRKGVAGDWANHFTAEHRAAFKQKYGDLVVRLGYEKNNDW